MLKILICCGGGFSSSYVTVRMKKEIKERHLEDQYDVEFSPFSLLREVMDDYDAIFLCPHLKMELEMAKKEFKIDKPVYLMPPRIYGMMTLDAIVEDAEDVMTMYEETHQVPVTFPHEENLLRIRRNKSYRSTYGDYHEQ